MIDRAQAALLRRLRMRLPAEATCRFEVPLPILADRRAWDAVIEVAETSFAVEAETRLRDIQATTRRIALKQRDGRMAVVVLLVSDTAANRRTLAEHRSSLLAQFPLDGPAILRSIATGRPPAASGILVL